MFLKPLCLRTFRTYTLQQTCVVMCIPNTFLFEHVEARVNVRRWDRTALVLLVKGVERESSIQGAKPRLLAYVRLTNTHVEGERKMVRGHRRRLFTSLCTKFNYQDDPNPLASPPATPHVQYLKSPLSNTQPQMAIGWACLQTGERYV